MSGDLPVSKQAVSGFYERIATEFDTIADELLGKGKADGDLEWLHELRFKAVQIRAGADSLATWLAQSKAKCRTRRAD